MNVPSPSRPLILLGWGLALAVAMLWSAVCEVKGVQSSFGNVDAPVPRASGDPAWPAVDWGIEPAFPGNEVLRSPVGRESIPGLGNDAGATVLSLRSASGDLVLNFGANQDLGLGPVVSVEAPAARETPGSNAKETGPIRLGNVTFNQAADSLNVWRTDTAKGSDLSRQFQTETITPNVAQSSSIGGWAIAALAAIAVIIAMAIGYYENDRDDRNRRRSSRKSRRRHRRAS
jgi:hypothetical protein